MRTPLLFRLVPAALLLALSVLAGCSDLGKPILLRPLPELSADSLDFGVVSPGNSETRTLVIGNHGDGVLRGSAALQDAPSIACDRYAIVSGGGAFEVAPGGTHTIVVRFLPLNPGPVACTLHLGAGLPDVALRGAGAQPVATPGCSISTGVLDYGSVNVNQVASRTIRVRSTGTAPLQIQATSSCSAFFVFIGGGPRTIAPGDSLELTVNFAPTVGGRQTCTLTLGPDCPSVALDGTGISVSFARDLAPTLASYGCTNCHAYNTPGDLVSVAADFSPGALLVKRHDAANSVLYARIANLRTYGRVMPPGSTGMSTADRAKWFNWIMEGALDN